MKKIENKYKKPFIKGPFANLEHYLGFNKPIAKKKF